METAAAGKAIAWLWDQFADETTKDHFRGFLQRKTEAAREDHEKLRYAHARWMGFSWGQAAQRYQEHMQSTYEHIRVLGTTEPKEFDEIFTDVNIIKKPRSFERFDITQIHKLQREPDQLEKEERIPGLRVVVQGRGHRLYILGKPGAGKTTFLKYLVTPCGRCTGSITVPLPLTMPLIVRLTLSTPFRAAKFYFSI